MLNTHTLIPSVSIYVTINHKEDEVSINICSCNEEIMRMHIFRSRVVITLLYILTRMHRTDRIRVSITKTIGHMSQQNTRMYLQRRITRYCRSHV